MYTWQDGASLKGPFHDPQTISKTTVPNVGFPNVTTNLTILND